jgi:thioredoxin reductase
MMALEQLLSERGVALQMDALLFDVQTDGGRVIAADVATLEGVVRVEASTFVDGTGRKAVGLALDLTTWTREIIICTNGEPPGFDRDEYCQKLDALNIPVLDERITHIKTTGESREIYSIELDGGMCLDADKLFFTFGQRAADDLGAQLGCESDDDGQIIVDDHYHTSVRNVFAAGDIVPGPQLAVAAAADGAIAALSIHKSLIPAERKLDPV